MSKTYDNPVTISEMWKPSTPEEKRIPWEDVLALFAEISSGRVTVTPDGDNSCQLFWKTSNGWRLEVFDDCGQWDYIDHIWAPDGRELAFDDIMWRYNDRIPTEEELQRIWWHPGWYCRYQTKPPSEWGAKERASVAKGIEDARKWDEMMEAASRSAEEKQEPSN